MRYRLHQRRRVGLPGDPNITYPSLPANSVERADLPLPGTDAGGTINGSTLPFSAAADQSDLAAGGVNNRLISIPQGSDAVWTYFGCHLNVYDPSVLFGHYDANTGWPPVGTIASSPRSLMAILQSRMEMGSSRLRRTRICSPSATCRSRLLGDRGFPGASRRSSDVRYPSQSHAWRRVPREGYPDELMIDWGNTARGATAEIHWPQVDSADVLALAAKLTPARPLCGGWAHPPLRSDLRDDYVPVPSGGGESFAGLITVTLPAQIRVGQQFEIVVRRVTSRRLGKTADAREGRAGGTNLELAIRGRHVPDDDSRRERWGDSPGRREPPVGIEGRLQRLGVTDRWYPVLQRYISVVTSRVRGLGGDPAKISHRHRDRRISFSRPHRGTGRATRRASSGRGRSAPWSTTASAISRDFT